MTKLQTVARSNKSKPETPLFSLVNVADRQRAMSWITDRLRRHREGDMFSETVTITPAAAEYILLNHNKGNRPVREKKVTEFVRVITGGRWKLTSQGVSFSREGVLNNGQHRLAACVASGRSIDMRVTWGEERDAFDVLDTGTLRGGSDVLHVSGFKNTTTLASACRLINFLENGRYEIKNDEVLEVLSHHPALNDVAGSAHSIGAKFRSSSAAVAIAMYLIKSKSGYAARLPEFVDSLSEGTMLPKWSAVLALRDGMKEKKLDKGTRGGVTRSVILAACFIKSWNAWVRGERMKTLRYSQSYEKFPEVE